MAKRIINRVLLGKLLLRENDLPEDAEILNIQIHKNGLIKIEHTVNEEGGSSLKIHTITRLTHLHDLS